MSEQKEQPDIAALFMEVKQRGWAAALQLGDFEEYGPRKSDTRFTAYVWTPDPSGWGHHSDEAAVLPENLEWDSDLEPEMAYADTPDQALADAMTMARSNWEGIVKDRAELRADNRESDAHSAAAGATT